ncbi:response regulator [Fluviispira multicolorata]|uniref:Response regulator n=1 Tax=Fluviispira multicolorata TaxID=2654512 RepID=A0A833JA91_9BACT|nr:response regulator [Fluviispira multicolorata]KAB8027729.1 response regulator [Fluviispira multicolorata]
MVYPNPQMNILIVDDFPTMRKIIKSVLKQLGYQNISEAEDGQLALNFLKVNPQIEFIVSDWNMPNMTGIELLKMVRADPKLKHLPFLMVTAEADKDNIVEAVKSGVNNYIVKPFNAATMKEKIDKIFIKK